MHITIFYLQREWQRINCHSHFLLTNHDCTANYANQWHSGQNHPSLCPLCRPFPFPDSHLVSLDSPSTGRRIPQTLPRTACRRARDATTGPSAAPSGGASGNRHRRRTDATARGCRQNSCNEDDGYKGDGSNQQLQRGTRVQGGRVKPTAAHSVEDHWKSVFQLGIFLRALRLARTVLRPPRFTHRHPN